MTEYARFECDCGHSVERPRMKDGHPECLTCGNMVWVEDVEVDYNDCS